MLQQGKKSETDKPREYYLYFTRDQHEHQPTPTAKSLRYIYHVNASGNTTPLRVVNHETLPYKDPDPLVIKSWASDMAAIARATLPISNVTHVATSQDGEDVESGGPPVEGENKSEVEELEVAQEAERLFAEATELNKGNGWAWGSLGKGEGGH